jgi:class 3 adenylate cyclase
VSTEKKSTASGSRERKLAAILSAAVKGFSRLMGEAEEATLRKAGLK